MGAHWCSGTALRSAGGSPWRTAWESSGGSWCWQHTTASAYQQARRQLGAHNTTLLPFRAHYSNPLNAKMLLWIRCVCCGVPRGAAALESLPLTRRDIEDVQSLQVSGQRPHLPCTSIHAHLPLPSPCVQDGRRADELASGLSEVPLSETQMKSLGTKFVRARQGACRHWPPAPHTACPHRPMPWS